MFLNWELSDAHYAHKEELNLSASGNYDTVQEDNNLLQATRTYIIHWRHTT